ncbi:Fur family transcriptional regulator [Prochlorococcus sp. MIT 1300]|uniref:Fur family transcriptional regulator n=1 Tax=Prochlorococcus sp. MIT 1300 TaxID=3096218 RepID=UPI002A761CEB|nr:Fur family transcriptional regulator [Prochlorococcus sp. MIT 1300]
MTSSSPRSISEPPLQVGLHKDGRRMTPQRRRVLELFQNIGSGSHLSAEDVHQYLVNAKLKVSLATIYRTLRLLVDMGFLHELELTEGGHRFELASHDHPDHHHLVCVRCGRTEEFESEQVLLEGRIAAERIGFHLVESTLNVRAICPKCQTSKS